MELGHPTSVANNIWQLGLTFASMLFGDVLPTRLELMRQATQDGMHLVDDSTSEGRRLIRMRIRQRFNIRVMPGYDSLVEDYGDIMQLLEGMLEVAPERRWTAAQSLDVLQEIARRSGIKVLGPRAVPLGPLADFQ